MGTSTWHNTITGIHAATHDSYAAKTARQRSKPEVRRVMADVDGFARRKREELATGTYQVGPYRHFRLHDKKKARDISVLPYEDRCVQNALKDAIEPLLLRQMTDDMYGGLPGRGILAGGTGRGGGARSVKGGSTHSHQLVARMKQAMNNPRHRYYLQADIRKFYDSIDNVVTMRLVERCIKDKRTLALIRQHLFAQKKLAIGDPFSHLLANLNMSVIIRKAKAKYGSSIEVVNFADDIIVFAEQKATLAALRRDLQRWAKEQRLHYKPMYIRPVPGRQAAVPAVSTAVPIPAAPQSPITFCGYRYRPGQTLLTRRTKLRYVRARHRCRSVASYNGLMQVADTKHLRQLIEQNDNRHMADKIRRPFAGRPMKIETLEGIAHTIVDMQEKPSKQNKGESYWHVQAIADGLGLVVYSTGSAKIGEFLQGKTRHDLPLRSMRIVHDWSGFYYDGTVYTDAEEEEMIRKQFNIPKP